MLLQTNEERWSRDLLPAKVIKKDDQQIQQQHQELAGELHGLLIQKLQTKDDEKFLLQELSENLVLVKTVIIISIIFPLVNINKKNK